MSGNDRKGRVISFEIQPKLIERFNDVLIRRGLNKSETMRHLINEYIINANKEDLK